MFKGFTFFCLVLMSSVSVADERTNANKLKQRVNSAESSAESEPKNWTVGVGLIVSDNRFDDPNDDGFSPTVNIGDSNYMLIPNISWTNGVWSVGANGVSLQHEYTPLIKVKATLGFPSSGLELSGNKSWLRYKLATGYSISSETFNHSFNFTGLNVGFNHTIGDDMQKQWTLGFGAPLYLNKEKGITVIASAGLDIENHAWAQENYRYAIDNPSNTLTLETEDFYHASLSNVAIYQYDENWSLLFTAKHQWLDDELMKNLNFDDAYQLSIFSLLSYKF
jgi:hypothetical protein